MPDPFDLAATLNPPDAHARISGFRATFGTMDDVLQALAALHRDLTWESDAGPRGRELTITAEWRSVRMVSGGRPFASRRHRRSGAWFCTRPPGTPGEFLGIDLHGQIATRLHQVLSQAGNGGQLAKGQGVTASAINFEAQHSPGRAILQPLTSGLAGFSLPMTTQ